MTVLLVSASPLVQVLVSALLFHTLAIRVIPCSSDPVEIRTAITRTSPVLVLMDGTLSGDDLASEMATLQLHHPYLDLILLGSDQRQGSRRWEARDTRLQVESPTLLAELVIAVRQRMLLLPGAPASQALFDPVLLRKLAPRERAVLDRLAEGCSSLEVAQDLGVTRQTVETYRRNLCQKLGVSGSRLVRAAVLNRLLNAAEQMV